MQRRYDTVDELIEALPQAEQVIVKRLRALILACLPKATEKLDGIPFYTGKRMICYIWPPSLSWSPERQSEKQLAKGVSLGFCQGNKMANPDGVLLAEGRKQVYCMYFKSGNEIDEDQIRTLLFEAEVVDESFRKHK